MWIAIGFGTWFAAGLALALLIGKSVKKADQEAAKETSVLG
jgi:hypothetical protein